MYEMLTGTLPIQGESPIATMTAHFQTPPRPIGQDRPDLNLPDAIANLVMSCLEKNKELRPQTAEQLIETLETAEKAMGLVDI